MAALLFGGSFLGGGGAGSWVWSRVDEAAIQACYDNSQIAIGVAEQHGDELLALRRLIEERTSDRYTRTDAAADWRSHERDEILQNRRIEYLERRMDGTIRTQTVPENE